jgi:hypothetical protein
MTGQPLIELVSTIVLPEYRGRFYIASAFEQAGIQASDLFKQMLFNETTDYFPEKEINCFKALSEIKTLNLADALGANFLTLSPIDICRLAQLDDSQPCKLSRTGACNTVLVTSGKGSVVVWHAQIFKVRDAGWKAQLYANPSVLYGELIFSGCLSK